MPRSKIKALPAPVAAVPMVNTDPSVNGFCARQGVCRTFAYDEIKSGRLIAHKAGKRTIIFPEDEASWRRNLPILKPQHDGVGRPRKVFAGEGATL